VLQTVKHRLPDPMEPMPKPNAQDSTMLVTMTRGELRSLIKEEIQAARAPEQDPDRLLSADEAATLLSVSEDWLYRHAKKLPFTRKLGPKMLRFSYQGIVKWMATRKLS
jgi:predicted DNA-binding transcriptional regulator AlpA